MSLIDPTQSMLESAMSGSLLRQRLLTGNLANANTPGYQPQDVDFQSALAQVAASGTAPDAVTFQPRTLTQATSPDGNGVSADQTSAQIAENGLLYKDLTGIAAAREGILKSAMGLA